MDGEVRVIRGDAAVAGVGRSHTVHSISPSSKGSRGPSESSRSPRDRLIAGTVEVLADSSVDRLAGSRDTPNLA